MNKEYMRETIIFTAKDKDGNKVESTPHLFVEALAKATGTTISAMKTKVSKSSSRFKNFLQKVLNEERLPTGGELMSLTTILGTRKDKVEKAFAELVKVDTISSNGTKESEVNTLNFQITWPKNWGIRNDDLGEAICNLFKSEDFKNDAIFCNYTDSNGKPIDTVTVGADAGKFESAQSFGKLIDGFRTLLHHVYIDSPFESQVDALDDPIYDLLDEDVYNALHEVVLNGSVEDVDLDPLQMYLYRIGVLDLPNVNDDKVLDSNDTKISVQTPHYQKRQLEKTVPSAYPVKNTGIPKNTIIDVSATSFDYNKLNEFANTIPGEVKITTSTLMRPNATSPYTDYANSSVTPHIIINTNTIFSSRVLKELIDSMNEDSIMLSINQTIKKQIDPCEECSSRNGYDYPCPYGHSYWDDCK